MINYKAAMASLQHIREGLTALSSQVGSGDLIASVILQLVAMVDVMTRVEIEQSTLAQQSASELRLLHEKCAQTQGG